MIRRILFFTSVVLFASAVSAKEEMKAVLQKTKGFVGYVEAGTKIEVKSLSLDSQVVSFIDPYNTEVGLLQATFKNFERALGDNKKVEYLNKVEALPGRTFVLKYNLVLKAL